MPISITSTINRIRKHPYWSVAVSVLTVLASIWFLFSTQAPIPTILHAMHSYISVRWALIVLAILLLVISAAVVWVVAAGAVKWEREAKQMRAKCDEQASAIQDVAALKEELRTRTGERDGWQQAYQRCKKNFALFRFEAFAAEGAMTEERKVYVTIRYVDTADFALVEEIEQLLKKYTKWKVSLKQATDPVLRPHKELKVVVVAADETFLVRLQSLLDSEDGRLLECRVGYRHELRSNPNDLLIEVLPTTAWKS